MTALSTPRDNQIHVSMAPHPFSVERIDRHIQPGLSITEIMTQLQPDESLKPYAHVYINGAYIPQDNWPQTRPKTGTTVTIRMVPMGGGGGKNPLRTVLSLAVMAASPMLAASLGTAFGSSLTSSFLGFSTSRILTTGINLLGRLAMNAIAPPGRNRNIGQKESQTVFIRGARNQASPFSRVPMVLGQHRMVPPLGALPYTETVGNDQYLRMLFIWGYGPLNITDLKIGETAIEDFDDVEIETRYGYEDDAPLTLYSDSILQNDMEIMLKQADGYVTRRTETDADEISIDITCPRGLFAFDSKNRKVATNVQIEVQYSEAGSNDWSAGANIYTSFPERTLTVPAKPAIYVDLTVNQVTRFDRIVMDPASGALKTLTGTNFIINKDSGSPKLPPVPADMILLATLERRSDEADIIPPARVKDERNQTATGQRFELASDFAVSASHLAANTIIISAGGLKCPGVNVTAAQTAALRHSLTFKVPRGQYDVRVRRITPDSTNDNLFDETAWTALRTIRHASPVKMPGIAMTAIRIKATDQLNGIIDRFNGVAQSLVRDWTGEEWILQPTSNPAALFRHVLQGKGNARPLDDSRIDMSRIQQWHQNCRDTGREYNAVIDYDTSVRDVLQDIASAGRASPALLDGKWAVIEDRLQLVPVQHFTPANTSGFRGEKSFDELPHALRIRFANRDKGWEQDERLVFDDGYNETNANTYETLELPGVTDPDQAWKDGRYHIATARLRPESYSFTCDIEHIVCTRGDLVRFTHDVPLIGVGSGRVASVIYANPEKTAVAGVVLDNDVEMAADKSYSLRLRLADGGTIVKSIQKIAGTRRELLFETPESVTEDFKPGILALFGESGRESIELIVKAIEPQSDLSARLTLVDAAPGVHTADKREIPAFSSQITLPADMQRPPAPVLQAIQSGEEVIFRNPYGTLEGRIVITLKPPASMNALTPRVTIRGKDESIFRPATVDILTPTSLSLSDIDMNGIYDIQLRYATATGSISAPLSINNYLVQGILNPPSDVTGFSLSVLGNMAHLTWSRNTDIDIDHYRLRFSNDAVNASWESATPLLASLPCDSISTSVPALSGTYLIKAVDSGGRESVNAARATTTMPSLNGYNAVFNIAEAPDYRGTHEFTGRGDFGLQLAGLDCVDDWTNRDLAENTDIGGLGMAVNGTYLFRETVDLGSVCVSRLSAQLSVSSLDLTGTTDAFGNIDNVESFDQTADPASWGCQLQVRTTMDDPANPLAGWTAWSDFIIADHHARGYQFRVVLSSVASFITPLVQSLEISIDMPDRTISGSQITSMTGGTDILFNAAFRQTPAIAVTSYDMQSGDYYAISSVTAEGFSISFYNKDDVGISRVFDYVAKGYGEIN